MECWDFKYFLVYTESVWEDKSHTNLPDVLSILLADMSLNETKYGDHLRKKVSKTHSIKIQD